jgi:ABC-type antimicrobial peptide transport system permease subunit
MTLLRLIIRGAVFHRRAHLGALAGAMLSGAVLVGALLVGDSVKYSLIRSASLRLGGIRHAVSTGNRFFTQDLSPRLAGVAGVRAAPALLLRGVVMRQEKAGGAERRVNNVQVIGVDREFTGPGLAPPGGGAAVNAKIAAQLGIGPGDRISVRVEKPSLLPRDAPLSSRRDDDTGRGTLLVDSIMPDDKLGRFNLAADQVVPFNIFVGLKWLQETAALGGKANLLVSSEESRTVQQLNAGLAETWQLADAGLALRGAGEAGFLQLESERVFMDPQISRAALGAALPGGGSGPGAVGCLTYLVNSISTGSADNRCVVPYSFVMAMTPSADRRLGVVPEGVADDEIIVSRWLADRLCAVTGATVKVSYYELTPNNKFVERHRNFKLRGVVEMADIAGEKDLGPRFPGLTDADRCADWDIGLPLEEDKLADKANEDYWKTYRATPKAFVTLKAGREMWANRFGDLTAVRYAAGAGREAGLEKALRRAIDPAGFGLDFQPVGEVALRAAAEAMDFSGLFLGMSFFLIAAALMLTGLLFAFGVQQRSGEIGLLLAVGYGPALVRRMLLAEGCIVAALGAMAGAALGTLYTRAIIWGLGGCWQGAVAGAAIQYHAGPMTVMKGAALGFACAVVAMLLAIRRQVRRPASALLAGDGSEADGSFGATSGLRRGTRLFLSLGGVAVALAIVAHAVITGAQNAVSAFFLAGTLLLLSGLGLVRVMLAWLGGASGTLTVAALGLRHAGRSSGRSLTVAGLLACGCFMVFAVASMQEDLDADASKRSSGTGGFALYGESTLPLQDDPGSPAGRRKMKLDLEPGLEGVGIVPLKVRDGDDASCLNLNRAQSPRLVGVDPRDFATRGAFQTHDGGGNVWSLLEEIQPDGSVPGLAGDANTAAWGLGKRTGKVKGETLVYRDERGNVFKVKLVGSLPMRLSVFQGSVLIKVDDFTAKYPSESGYMAFLVDAPRGLERKAGEILSRRLEKSGIDIVPAVERLKEFYAVESTYMAMFLVLGGLGLLLGSAGMGVVVLRNIIERRSELALLRAVGYVPGRVRRVILAEHWLLLGAGLAVGILSSLAAMWPGLHSPGATIPYRVMALFLCGIVAFQLALIYICVRVALRRPLLSALRNE